MRSAGTSNLAQRYWIYQWMDAESITTVDEARASLLDVNRGRPAFREFAASGGDHGGDRLGSDGVVAGRGLDLSGELDCYGRECQIRQVDELFRRVLFYFDSIAVAGFSPEIYADEHWSPDETALEQLLSHVGILLDLRARELDRLLLFRAKPPIGADYLGRATDLGVDGLRASAGAWQERLAAESAISISRHGDHGHYTLNHPALEHTMWGHVHPLYRRTALNKRAAAKDVVSRYASALVSDIAAARELKLPLSSRMLVHQEWVDSFGIAGDVGATALRLKLPVLPNLTADQVLRLRKENRDAFEAFRHALTIAIRDRSSAGGSTGEVATEVVEDVVEPALRELRIRMDAADRALGLKVVAGGALGTLIATVGVLASAPLLAPVALSAAALSSIPALQKYADERAEIQRNDMYFLWKAERTHI